MPRPGDDPGTPRTSTGNPSAIWSAASRRSTSRAHLLYGQWLRRAKRRRGARAELRTAHDMFAAMGTQRFADLAAAELRATGEHTRALTPETMDDLTPPETRIAQLAGRLKARPDAADPSPR
jgi:hypothetical protein